MFFPPRTPLDWRILGAASEWRTSRVVSQDLPELASDALTADLDSPTLRVLAGMPPATNTFDLGTLLTAAVDELDRAPTTTEQAWRGFVAYRCWLIVTGRIGRLDGLALLQDYEAAEDEDCLGALARFDHLDDFFENGRAVGWSPYGTEELLDLIAWLAQKVVDRYLSGRALAVPYAN